MISSGVAAVASPAAFRRLARRPADGDRGSRWHGRRPAARRDHERRRLSGRRGRPHTHREAAGEALSRRVGAVARRGARARAGGPGAPRGGLDRRRSERRRSARTAARRRCPARRRHRPDVGARQPARLCTPRPVVLSGDAVARERSRGLRRTGDGLDGRARAGDARAAKARCRDLRLRQQPARAGTRRRRRG